MKIYEIRFVEDTGDGSYYVPTKKEAIKMFEMGYATLEEVEINMLFNKSNVCDLLNSINFAASSKIIATNDPPPKG